MRVILTLLATLFLAVEVVAQETSDNRAEWRLSTKRTAYFLKNNKYPSLIGKGQMSFVGKKATAGLGSKKYHPAVSNTRVGDYWLLTMPSEGIQPGTAVDFFMAFLAAPSELPIGFALEYLDGGKWKSAKQPINKSGATCVSPPSDSTPRFVWQTVRFEEPVQDSVIQFRLRQCEKGVTKWTVFGSANGDAPKLVRFDERIPQDTTNLLFIGNSYTFYHIYPHMLKEMAWNEGHYLDCSISVHGGYSIQKHLNDPVTIETIEQGGYEYVFLQEGSTHALRIGTRVDKGTIPYMQKMLETVRATNPNATPIMAHLWARKEGVGQMEDLFQEHPEYFKDYQTMQRIIDQKTLQMAELLGVATSPIGPAWNIVRRERPDIELYRPDNYHPSANGAYLQAVVAYMLIFNKPFENPLNLELEAETAAYLRSVAERVVLKGERIQ